MIDYLMIGEALSYYKNLCKYKEIDAPWLVRKQAIDITKPPHARYFDTFAGQLVGSGEQSLLDIRGCLTFDTKYVCATPCFRDEAQQDTYHLQYFFKVELMHVVPIDPKKAFDDMLREALYFHSKHAKFSSSDVDVANTEIGVDINVNGIEVGSYGTREFEGFSWVYGTGVAEPRFTQAMQKRG